MDWAPTVAEQAERLVCKGWRPIARTARLAP